MRQVMVRYKVKPDRVEENERLAGVRDRCDEPPVVTGLHEVGCYRP